MTIDASTFETLIPSRFITFTYPNPFTSPQSLLRFAVLDSPVRPIDGSPARVAAMLVPENREHDWIFCTESGHHQLLLSSPGISRLVLIGKCKSLTSTDSVPAIYNRPVRNDERSSYRDKLEAGLLPLLVALSPKCCVGDDSLFDIPFLSYEDSVVQSLVVEKCVGSRIGEMLVEDVEIECGGSGDLRREFRRRLRFKRMPNLIQTEIRIVPVGVLGLDRFGICEVEFQPDLRVLVHPYLAPMVAGLSLVGDCIEKRIRCGFRPRALCLGVGGGALLVFMKTQLGFEVTGVEEDIDVLRMAKLYFGLKDDVNIQILVGDGIEMMKNISDDHSIKRNSSSIKINEEEQKVPDNIIELRGDFDVIMVDLDSSNIRNGIVAPPVEFVQKCILSNARLSLRSSGILILNVIPPSMSFYHKLVCEFKEVFCELYEIEVGNEENYILIASVSPIEILFSECENAFMTKLTLAVSGEYIDSIRKI